jgi:hypothetical protein
MKNSGKIRRKWGGGRRERSVSWKAVFVFIFMASSKIVLTSKKLERCQANVKVQLGTVSKDIGSIVTDVTMPDFSA